MPFHMLVPAPNRDDLSVLSDYEVGRFDLTVFWKGKPVLNSIPTSVRLWGRYDVGGFPDLLPNPLSWTIISARLWAHLRGTIEDTVQVFPLVIEWPNAPMPHTDYLILHPVVVVDCVNWVKSTVSRRPDGRVRAIDDVVIRSIIPTNIHVLRLQECEQIILFSDSLARSLVGQGFTGIAFLPCRHED